MVKTFINGSSSAESLLINPTWNTTGTPAVIRMNVIDTASNAASLLLDMQVGGTTRFNVNKAGTAQISSIYISGDHSTVWSNHAGIETDNRRVNLASGEYGDLIEDLTSVYVSSGFSGYAGAYFTAYVYGNNAAPSPAAGAYVVGVSGLPVYDNAGATALSTMAGFNSGMSSTLNSPVTNGYDFWARELNSVSRVAGLPTMTNHYAFYSEAFTKATNNWGVYINGTQRNYFGGVVGIGQNNPTAALDVSQSLTGTSAISSINIATTWNTTGNPSLIKANVTNTASGSTAKLLDIAVGGANRFALDKTGNVTYVDNVTFSNASAGVTAEIYSSGNWKIGSLSFGDLGSPYVFQAGGSIASVSSNAQFTLYNSSNSTFSSITRSTNLTSFFQGSNQNLVLFDSGNSRFVANNTSTDTGQLLQVAGSQIISHTLTGSSAVTSLEVSPTWNTTGSPSAIKVNVTNTASGSTAKLLDIEVGGANRFALDKTGNIKYVDNVVFNTASVSNAGTIYSSGNWGIGSGAVTSGDIGAPYVLQVGGGAMLFGASPVSLLFFNSGNFTNLQIQRLADRSTLSNAGSVGIILYDVNQNVRIGTLTDADNNVKLQVDSAGAQGAIITSQSVTGGSSYVNLELDSTWNTTGTPTVIKSNVTNTASGAGSLLLDLQVGGTSKFKIGVNGKIGVSVASPSALLHIAAGTATAGTAPIKLGTGGILNTTPESQAIESTDTHLYWTNTAGTRLQLDQQSTTITPSSASDANYTILSSDTYLTLPSITSNRTLTLPTATGSGRIIVLKSTNTVNLYWNVTGTLKDVQGNSVTTIKNNSITEIIDDISGTWTIKNLYTNQTANNIKNELHTVSQSTAITGALTYTDDNTSGGNAVYRIGASLNVNSVTTNVIKVQISWHDENNTTQTIALIPMGLTSALVSTTGYVLYPTVDIYVKNGTTISVDTVFTTGGGSINYDLTANITQLNVHL